MDRKPDCAAAAVSRQQLAAFTAALKVRDCDAAASIAQALERGAQDVQACRVGVQRDMDLAAYSAAKDAKDCGEVRRLSAQSKSRRQGLNTTLPQHLQAKARG
jgi:hypothetical protein